MDIAYQIEARAEWEKLSEWQKFQAMVFGTKRCLGEEVRSGWMGPIATYLFWCHVCQHPAKCHPNGYSHQRVLCCSYCGAKHSFRPWWIPIQKFWVCAKYALLGFCLAIKDAMRTRKSSKTEPTDTTSTTG